MSFQFVDESVDTEVVLLGGDQNELSSRIEFGVFKEGADVARVQQLMKDSQQLIKDSQQLTKESQQKPPAAETYGFKYKEPRVSFDTLGFFLDINTWHKRCVNLKARLVGGMGWMLVTEDEDKEEDDQCRAIKAMLKSPQKARRVGEPRLTFTEAITRMLVDYYNLGNGFLEVPRNARLEVAEVYHMMAATTRRDTYLSKGYHQLDQGQPIVHLRGFDGEEPAGKNEVIHLMDYDPLDPWYGSPQWAPAMGVALLDRTQVEYNTYLFQNGLMAHFAVIVEGGKLSDAQVTSLKSFIRNNATGVQNAGRGVVLQNDSMGVKIRIEKLNVDMKNMQITEGRNQSRDEIIAAHGVPPRLVGVVAAGQLGGGGENEGQLHTFLETVIRPDQERLEDLLNSTIIASFGGDKGLDGVKWRLKFKTMDTSDRGEDADYYTKALSPTTGWLTQDEVRQEQELEPLEGDLDTLVDAAKSDPENTASFLKALRKSYQ